MKSIRIISLIISLLVLVAVFFIVYSSKNIIGAKLGTKEKALHTRLLYRLEERDMTKNKVIEYRVHENGLVFRTVLHKANAAKEEIFQTRIYKADSKWLDKAKELIDELGKVKYDNDFPWKEKLEEKGDTITIEFPGLIKLNCFPKKAQEANCKDAHISKSYLYYTGHKDSPQIFAELLNFTKSI